jgi:hypothetical protein
VRVAETTFEIVYDGPALATGTMPVRDLAPALIALGDLFVEASAVLHPDWEPVALNIKATEEGSFLVRLTLESEGLWDQLVNVFGSPGASALTNLRDFVLTAGGLFWLIKRLKGRKIAFRENTPTDPGTITLTLDDQTKLEVPAEVLTLYRSIEIRKQARQVVAPLAREGVEVVKFTARPNEEEVAVEKGDLPAYELPEGPDEPLLDEEREMFVEIASVAFIEGNKWRLSDGGNTFWASVEDASFLERVERGAEVFRKGDKLRCLIRLVQSQPATGGLQTDYHVVKVIEHRPSPTQLSLGDD